MGTGHLMRCLSLAKAMRRRGHQVTFACIELAGNTINLIEDFQFLAVRYSANDFTPDLHDPKTWIPSEEEDAKEFVKTCQEQRPDWIVVDHYALGKSWESQVSAATKVPILVIDDLFREHQCEALLDQNYHSQHLARWASKVPKQAQLFLGPQFALLAETFANFTPQVKRGGPVSHLTAFFGGTDVQQGSEYFVDQWSQRSLKGLTVTLLLGAGNQRASELEKQCAKIGIECVIASKKVADILATTSLYVGSGGSITWERAFFGIPALAIATAQNQVAISQELESIGAHKFLGLIGDLKTGALQDAIETLRNDQNLYTQMSEKSLALRVGQATHRVIELLATHHVLR